MKIVTRAGWKAQPPRKWAEPIEVKGAVVHHTAGGQASGADIIHAIQFDHLGRKTPSGQPWWDIGYNYLIDAVGTVYHGRIKEGELRGSHSPGKNRTHVGIALLGNFQTVHTPTEAQVGALVELCVEIQDRHEVSEFEILGHRDARATDCPGQALYDMLPTIRHRVDARDTWRPKPEDRRLRSAADGLESAISELNVVLRGLGEILDRLERESEKR